MVFLCATATLAYSWATVPIDTAAWADLALKTIIPIFVLGISVVNLTRSLSESGRFTGEYLNESCRMSLFSRLALLAGLAAFTGWLMGKISFFPSLLSAFVAGGSIGAAIACFAMLAFIIRETIRCLVPGQAIEVVSQYASAKLCHAYLKEVYVRLFQSRHNAHLEKWCAEHCRAIHPPSRYYGHYLRSTHGSGRKGDSCVIRLEKKSSDTNTYKDFHIQRLATLDRYLSENGAELYLSSPLYDSERDVLGMLTFSNGATNAELRAAVERMGARAVRFRSMAFAEESDEFWESQQSALDEAMQRAVDRADPTQVRAYLDAVNKPLRVLRKTRQRRSIRDVYGENVRRGYDFLRLYLVALDEILAGQERGPKHRAKHTSALARVLLKSIWEETHVILKDMDYHTMELFAWVVRQMYQAIQEAGEKAGPLQGMRAEFGGFYAFADGWLEDAKSEDADAVEKMRLVLYDGLTKWLLGAIAKKDAELIEQLCDAARTIVFGHRDDITLDRGSLVVRHFVLAGYLIGHAQADGINPEAIERLFWERHSHDLRVNFDDIVTFYRTNRFPHKTVEPYLRIFYQPKKKTIGLLTGSSSSSGFGMTGQHEMALAFIYMGALVLAERSDKPKVIPQDMSFEVTDAAINTVADLFKGSRLDHGIARLTPWRDECKQATGGTEDKAIADAKLNASKMDEWRKEFWDAYLTSSPVLSLCLRNRNYEINNTAHTANLQARLPKIAVMDWKYPISGASGSDYAREFAEYMEGQLLAQMTAKIRASHVEGTLSDLMKRGAQWLRTTGCEGENAVIVAMTKHGPNSELFRDESYVPSWREDIQSRGFDGFYDGFPVIWYRSKDTKDVKREQKDSPGERVVAVNLREWQGVKVQERVITRQEFGELTIRTWTDKEIQDALDSKKLEMKDVNKAKGSCPVDISLYWELSSCRPPHRRIFQIRGPSNETSSEDTPKSTGQ